MKNIKFLSCLSNRHQILRFMDNFKGNLLQNFDEFRKYYGMIFIVNRSWNDWKYYRINLKLILQTSISDYQWIISRNSMKTAWLLSPRNEWEWNRRAPFLTPPFSIIKMKTNWSHSKFVLPIARADQISL